MDYPCPTSPRRLTLSSAVGPLLYFTPSPAPRVASATLLPTSHPSPLGYRLLPPPTVAVRSPTRMPSDPPKHGADDRQAKFILVPAQLAPAGPPKPPMTSKQAKKAYAESTRAPRISREEQRRLDQAERDRIRREQEQDKERERASRLARARAARDKKRSKARDDARRHRAQGLPTAGVPEWQTTLGAFVRRTPAGTARTASALAGGETAALAPKTGAGPTPSRGDGPAALGASGRPFVVDDAGPPPPISTRNGDPLTDSDDDPLPNVYTLVASVPPASGQTRYS